MTTLRSYAPDSFALGSALFYYAIAEYYNTTPSTNTTTPIPPSSSSYASMMSNEEIEEILENCINHLTESISSPWTELSKKRKILCYLCRGKTYQRLKQYENSINDLTYCIQLYESNHEELEIENTTTIQSQDYDPSDAAYAYFRRAWSYKVFDPIYIYYCYCCDILIFFPL